VVVLYAYSACLYVWLGLTGLYCLLLGTIKYDSVAALRMVPGSAWRMYVEQLKHSWWIVDMFVGLCCLCLVCVSVIVQHVCMLPFNAQCVVWELGPEASNHIHKNAPISSICFKRFTICISHILRCDCGLVQCMW